ncbi:hypothetical protein SteCoe_25347 [Stentor coeruleus]|uniref:non-specific serine/threonine protein kinase n=1 Tax=Stentor coeruleus TaxID=5963 RepID=A0A1R2BFD9_9CILI|nr:hypothetical protein SteCoe_25347 [Stentor coeruleus]
MGSFCSLGTEVEKQKPKRLASCNCIEDILFSSGLFIQENQSMFSSIYNLISFPIGYGSYGEVWICDHIRSKEKRAVKIIDKLWLSSELIDKKSVLNEVDILKTLDHPNILKIFEYFEDERYYYIVMEYCPEGDLFDELEKVNKYDEDSAAKIMSQIFSAVSYIHNKNIVHRDIKLENILISSRDKNLHIKLIDFNIATFNIGKRLSKFTGTSFYIAPEVIKENYDEKCDVWSCGVIMFLLLTGKFPFDGSSREEILSKISQVNLNLKSVIMENISPAAKNLLELILMKNPKSRYTAKQALEHPWIRVNGCQRTDDKVLKKTLTRMLSITKKPKLKEVFQIFILGQVQENNQELKHLESVFLELDEDRNGVISRSELTDRLCMDMNLVDALKEVERIWKLVDNDGSGNIDYTEFLRAALQEESYVCKENLRKAFYYFDKDRSDTIEKQELMSWLSEGAIIPMEVIENLIEDADANGDGVIDFEEFQDLLIEKIEQEEFEKSAKNEHINDCEESFSLEEDTDIKLS